MNNGQSRKFQIIRKLADIKQAHPLNIKSWVVLKAEYAPESSGGFVTTVLLGPNTIVSYLVGLKWVLRICIFDKFPPTRAKNVSSGITL